jgi:hypothetical protein
MCEATSWFVHDLEIPIQKSAVSVRSVSAFSEKTGNVTKKRKLRVGKQLDVGSLLGAFK